MIQKATFGGGCFWCTEALFSTLQGVQNMQSGYMGGHINNPTYEEVCKGTSGHAEVIQFDFDDNIISFENLLAVFFHTHNPTTLNQQGADIGTQYRSVIFYHSDKQRIEANNFINKLNSEGIFESKIVTEINPAVVFYLAEIYHQEYYLNHYRQPYCQTVIQPKLAKLLEKFRANIKQELL